MLIPDHPGYTYMLIPGIEGPYFSMFIPDYSWPTSIKHLQKFQLRIPLPVVEIMSKKPDLRTDDDINVILSMMSTIQSFRQYNQSMQLVLARIVRYFR